MPKKPGTNPKNEFVFFDVLYEDGTRRSNRRVPSALATNPKDDGDALGYLIAQDCEIAGKSGRAPLKIKSILREGTKPPKVMRIK